MLFGHAAGGPGKRPPVVNIVLGKRAPISVFCNESVLLHLVVLRVVLPAGAIERVIDNLALEAGGNKRVFVREAQDLEKARHDGAHQVHALELNLDVVAVSAALLFAHKLGVGPKVLVL